jgi:hypothetical protein
MHGTDYVFIVRRDWWPALQSELPYLPAYDDYADGSLTYLGAAIYREKPWRASIARWGDVKHLLGVNASRHSVTPE